MQEYFIAVQSFLLYKDRDLRDRHKRIFTRYWNNFGKFFTAYRNVEFYSELFDLDSELVHSKYLKELSNYYIFTCLAKLNYIITHF